MKAEAQTGSEAYLGQLRKKAFHNRVPISGCIELTDRCNLRCVHCYQGDRSSIKRDAVMELDTDQWKNIIDQFTEAGCFQLLMTGGEPLLRRDFAEIYTHAKMKGLLVTLFTNGTLLNDETIELFSDLPPLLIEISLYGATPQTYEKITGSERSYEMCMNGIMRLKNAGLSFSLKTPLITLNQHEYYEIEAIAKQLDVGFYFDPSIFPRFDGDQTPISLRIKPDEAVVYAFSDEGKRRIALEQFLKKENVQIPGDSLYSCGSGKTTFYITAKGILQPCLRALTPNFDLTKGHFSEGWQNELSKLGEKKVEGDSFPCKQCEKKILCQYCPPYFELETGDANLCSEYVCELTNFIWKYLEGMKGDKL